jgi:hypothetical protein
MKTSEILGDSLLYKFDSQDVLCRHNISHRSNLALAIQTPPYDWVWDNLRARVTRRTLNAADVLRQVKNNS